MDGIPLPVFPRMPALRRSKRKELSALVVLYLTFIDFGEMKSGSSVRPQKIYDAFLERGHTVKLLEGQQNRYKDRRKRVKAILDWLKDNRPDICYVEPPSGPFFCALDLKLLKTVHKMGIPVGLFYRDAYWLYADWWGVGGPKAALLKAMHKRDLKVFERCCDILYFPSLSMAELFHDRHFKRLDALPPACTNMTSLRTSLARRMIYVGGVCEAYGTDILLSAFKQINRDKTKVELYLVCRETEMANIQDKHYPDYDWLKIFHVQGKELETLYVSCDAGIIPRKRDKYMDFSIPVKLLEYLGYGLPVISTDCTEIAAFIEKNHCGLLCRDNGDSLAETIEAFYSENTDHRALAQNVQETAANNRWVNRVDKIVRDLSGQ